MIYLFECDASEQAKALYFHQKISADSKKASCMNKLFVLALA